ncbi:MAG: UvrB/UvrC motif-containing protein [Candidatus Pacebacteria bacterium]|nr:UvrB/UvrC motif-containing protein [Candidatus Paceibacterota bacterium]
MPLNQKKFKYVNLKDASLLPPTTGIYCFKKNKEFLYIGKAINIKERVKNHIAQPNFKDNIFVPQTQKIGFIATGSEIEALILEANLIQQHQPQYNTIWRDNKSHNFIAITNENYPRILITHQKNQKAKYIGPFIDGGALRQTLRILRRIFPYRTCNKIPKKACLYKELGLCLAPCEFKVQGEKLKIKNNIQNLIAILKGKKNSVIKTLRKEMGQASQQQNFEKAKMLRDQIFALENVFSHSHILQEGAPLLQLKEQSFFASFLKLQELLQIKNKIKRIEGYDVSNIQGQEATGSMVVFTSSQANKNEYRKFKIKISGRPNDTAMLKEVLSRRFRHKEWALPQVILIDGGKGQLNAALAALAGIGPSSENSRGRAYVMALAKRKNELFIESRKKPISLKDLPQEIFNLILQIRDESHRFAITYHKKLRSKLLIS